MKTLYEITIRRLSGRLQSKCKLVTNDRGRSVARDSGRRDATDEGTL